MKSTRSVVCNPPKVVCNQAEGHTPAVMPYTLSRDSIPLARIYIRSFGLDICPSPTHDTFSDKESEAPPIFTYLKHPHAFLVGREYLHVTDILFRYLERVAVE